MVIKLQRVVEPTDELNYPEQQLKNKVILDDVVHVQFTTCYLHCKQRKAENHLTNKQNSNIGCIGIKDDWVNLFLLYHSSVMSVDKQEHKVFNKRYIERGEKWDLTLTGLAENSELVELYESSKYYNLK